MYLLEQHGFRRIISTTFMMAFMFPRYADRRSVERYIHSLVRAQAVIDVEPEKYKHYFMNEIPERFRDFVDVRRFGVGERVVPQPFEIIEQKIRCLTKSRDSSSRKDLPRLFG